MIQVNNRSCLCSWFLRLMQGKIQGRQHMCITKVIIISRALKIGRNQDQTNPADGGLASARLILSPHRYSHLPTTPYKARWQKCSALRAQKRVCALIPTLTPWLNRTSIHQVSLVDSQRSHNNGSYQIQNNFFLGLILIRRCHFLH